MIRINLLPFRAARTKETARKQVGIFVLTLVVIGGALFGVHLYLQTRVQDLNTRVENSKRQLAKYKKINQEIAGIKKKLAILKQKTGVIKSLEANRRQAIDLLDAMTGLVIKDRMWFTKFQTRQKPAPRVEIEGVALDNKTVADFMTRLERAGFFSSVNLKNLHQQTVKGSDRIDLKHFNISCGWKVKQPSGTGKAKKK